MNNDVLFIIIKSYIIKSVSYFIKTLNIVSSLYINDLYYYNEQKLNKVSYLFKLYITLIQ